MEDGDNETDFLPLVGIELLPLDCPTHSLIISTTKLPWLRPLHSKKEESHSGEG